MHWNAILKVHHGIFGAIFKCYIRVLRELRCCLVFVGHLASRCVKHFTTSIISLIHLNNLHSYTCSLSTSKVRSHCSCSSVIFCFCIYCICLINFLFCNVFLFINNPKDMSFGMFKISYDFPRKCTTRNITEFGA